MPRIGGILFAAFLSVFALDAFTENLSLALSYLGWGWGRFPWSVYVIVAGPPFLLSILFLLNWAYREQLQTR